MIRILAIATILASCGHHHPASPSSTSSSTRLKAVYPAKLQAYDDEISLADNLWPSTTDCDATVWAATACLGGAGVVIGDAEYPVAGQLQRRPKVSGTCWTPNAQGQQLSASTASRDDAVLYMGCAFARKDVGALERFQTYVKANDGYLGQPSDPNLTLMTETLDAILARMIDKLGGQGGDPGRVIEAPGVKDYQDHIEVEEVLASTAANGGTANGWEIGLLDSLAEQFPHDALFEAAKGVYTGDCQTAPDLLLAPAVQVPSYVRGDQPKRYADAWWLRAAALVLSHCT